MKVGDKVIVTGNNTGSFYDKTTTHHLQIGEIGIIKSMINRNAKVYPIGNRGSRYAGYHQMVDLSHLKVFDYKDNESALNLMVSGDGFE